MTPKDTAEMFKELDAITEGTGLNVNTTSEIVQVDEGDANSFDTKLEEIVGDFDTWCKCGGDDCLRYNNYKSAKQAIKQLIASELGAIVDANIDPDYAVDTDRVYEVLMEWLGELKEVK